MNKSSKKTPYFSRMQKIRVLRGADLLIYGKPHNLYSGRVLVLSILPILNLKESENSQGK